MSMGRRPSVTRAVAAVAALFCGSQLAAADEPYHTNLESYQKGTLGMQPNQTFYSSSIVAPVLQINRFYKDKIKPEDAPYIFTAGGWNGTWGSVVFSSTDLSVVYQDYTYDALAQATRVWDFEGERVYAALEGGAMRIFNQSYHQMYAMRPQGDLKGVDPDTHEAVVTDDGTVLLIACPTETVNLTDHGGPSDGQVKNCKFQEINPKNNKVLFEFAVLDYFDPYDSVMDYAKGSVWDFSHQNSVQKLSSGDYIASYRHLSAVIKVNGSSGHVEWVMGGKRNQFKDVSDHDGAAYFAYQHEARVWNNSRSRFTIFDNAQLDNGFCDGKNCSRGLELEYDEHDKTVKSVGEWYHPQSLISSSRGGLQKMDNGHVFVAWGQNYGWTEHDENGDCILDFQRGLMGLSDDFGEIVTYRGWKDSWMPDPPWGPNISAVDNHVYVSWNGLVVSNWLLLLSDSRHDLDSIDKAVARSPRNGFETSFNLADHGSPKYARVVGLGTNDTVLGATPVAEMSTGKLFDTDRPVKPSTVELDRMTISTSRGVPVPTGDGSTDQISISTDSSAATRNIDSLAGMVCAIWLVMFLSN